MFLSKWFVSKSECKTRALLCKDNPFCSVTFDVQLVSQATAKFVVESRTAFSEAKVFTDSDQRLAVEFYVLALRLELATPPSGDARHMRRGVPGRWFDGTLQLVFRRLRRHPHRCRITISTTRFFSTCVRMEITAELTLRGVQFTLTVAFSLCS